MKRLFKAILAAGLMAYACSFFYSRIFSRDANPDFGTVSAGTPCCEEFDRAEDKEPVSGSLECGSPCPEDPEKQYSDFDNCAFEISIWCMPTNGNQCQHVCFYKDDFVACCYYAGGTNKISYWSTAPTGTCFHSIEWVNMETSLGEGTPGKYDWTIVKYNCLTKQRVVICLESDDPDLVGTENGDPSACEDCVGVY